jgi:hypothetical protein
MNRPIDRRRGFTLLEVCVSAFLLALVSVPIWGLLNSSSTAIHKVDDRKQARVLMREIMNRIESSDFLVLYDSFGVEPDSPSRIREGLTAGGRNPLKIPDHVLEALEAKQWTVKVEFRFMTRGEVQVRGGSADPDDPERRNSFSVFEATDTGILHLQGGYLKMEVSGPELRTQRIRRPVYCPLILGRPGLMISQCPALNAAIKREKFSNIP